MKRSWGEACYLYTVRLRWHSLKPVGSGAYFCKPARHGNIWPNLTEMCSHRSACRLKCLDTHTVTFLYLLAVKNRCGTPSTTTQSSHQASTGKQTDSSAIQLTNIRTRTHTHLPTRTPYHSGGRRFWSCDKLSSQLRLSMESFFVPSFDAVLVINSDKSSGSSTSHVHSTHARSHKHTFHVRPLW